MSLPGLLADLVLLLHLGFVVFVVTGALLVMRWRWIVWLHLPAALWGAAIELGGWICPLTPLENRLRQAAGDAQYSGGFVEHYVVPLLYPPGLDRTIQLALGLTVVVLNVVLYTVVWRRGRRDRGTPAAR